ncbi:YitT family protein [Aggregatilineales bacterium SYSU G02658]
MKVGVFVQKLREETVGLAMLSVGAIINAASVVIFLTPFNIAPSGVSGLAVILNTLIGTPIGLMTLLMNVPIQYLAYRSLGGLRPIIRTVFAVFVYSSSLDILGQFITPGIAGDDRMLNAIFGGVVGGLSIGVIMRAGGTLGGTSTLALLLQRRLGTPLSTTYLYTDIAVVFLAGLVYGWEGALYALIVIFISGLAADYVLEGPSVIRTAVIITDHADEVSQAILQQLGRGVTGWQATGMYTRQPRNVLYITIARTQVDDLRRIVVSIDPSAFIVIGQGHTAYGEGFRPARR